MDITKIKPSQLIIIIILIIVIHQLSHKRQIIEGLSSTNKVKLKSCLKRIINRDCTHPVKAARLNRECEYGDGDEYIGITCSNTNLVDSIICSHLIGNGACKCQFGRSIIAKSCDKPGVNKKCKMELRSDKVLLDHIVKFRKKAEKIQKQLTKKEKELNEKIKQLETESTELSNTKSDLDNKFTNQRTKISEIKDMIQNLIEEIKIQTKGLETCEGDLSEEKKEELVKLREKLQGGFLNLKSRVEEEKQKGFSKERALGIIQDQKKELLNLKNLDPKTELEDIELFNKMMDIRERQKGGETIDFVKELKDNAKLIGGTLLVIILSGVGMHLLLRNEKKDTIAK